MAEYSVKGSYYSYKLETNIIVDWLARTAKKYGLSQDVLCQPQEIPHDVGSHAHGQGQGQEPEKNTKSVKEPSIILPDAWLQLANFIEKIPDPAFEIPRGLFSALESAISTRREIQGAHDDDVFDLEKFEAVYISLRSRDSQGLKEGGGYGDSFDRLWKETVSNTGNENWRPKFRTEGDMDYYLSLYFLVKDIASVRRCVMELWNIYHHGDIDLLPVTLVTNFAIGLVRELEDEHNKRFPNMWSSYITKILPYAKSNRFEHYIFHKNLAVIRSWGVPLDIRLCEFVNDIMFQAHHMRELFKFMDLENRELLIYRAQEELKRPKTGKSRVMLPGEIPELYTKEREARKVTAKAKWLIGDKFHVALDDIMSRRQVNLWPILPDQIHMETLGIMGRTISRPYLELRSEVASAKVTIRKFERFCDLVNIHERLWAKRAAVFQENAAEIEEVPMQNFLEEQPFRCGTFLMQHRASILAFGKSVLDKQRIVTSMYQLYQIARKEKLIQEAWTDLEFFSSLFSDKLVFGSPAPESMVSCLNRIARKNDKGYERKPMPRESKHFAKISCFFMDYFREDEPFQPSVHKLVHLLLSILSSETGAQSRYSKILGQYNHNIEEIYDRWRRYKIISPTELLLFAAIAAQIEVQPICFDYLGLHRLCWKVFFDIQKLCKEKTNSEELFEGRPLADTGIICIEDGAKEENPELGESLHLMQYAAESITKHLDAGLGDAIVKSLSAEPKLEPLCFLLSRCKQSAYCPAK